MTSPPPPLPKLLGASSSPSKRFLIPSLDSVAQKKKLNASVYDSKLNFFKSKYDKAQDSMESITYDSNTRTSNSQTFPLPPSVPVPSSALPRRLEVPSIISTPSKSSSVLPISRTESQIKPSPPLLPGQFNAPFNSQFNRPSSPSLFKKPFNLTPLSASTTITSTIVKPFSINDPLPPPLPVTGLSSGPSPFHSFKTRDPISATSSTSSSSSSLRLPPSNHVPGSNSILVSPTQKGNPVLKYIRNVPWEFNEILADYQIGQTACSLFLR